MIQCSICIDSVKSPLALPCGHVFCSDCILAAVRATIPHTTFQSCPTCRQQYSTVNINPAFVPSTFRPYLTPSIRRLYLDVGSTTEPSPVSDEVKRLEAKLAALQASCSAYRHRIEFQSAATIGLMRFAKMASNYAMEMKKENDELREKLRLEQSTRAAPQIVDVPTPSPKKRSREELENEGQVESSSIRHDHISGQKKRRTILCH